MQYTMYGAYNRPYVKPRSIKNKEQYLNDIISIEEIMFEQNSTYGYNKFLHEWAQLLINAINLFEAGYFDCAFYSMRQAIELSVLIFYFVDTPDNEKKEKISAWWDQKNFPSDGAMLNELKDKGRVCKEINEKIPEFFKELRELKQVMNKIVHKQGFFYLYTIMNHQMIIPNKEQCEPILNFTKYLEKAIKLVAIIRILIDPFPIILRDSTIQAKVFCMTKPYSDNIIDKYIGKDFLLKYKNTNYYQEYYQIYLHNNISRIGEFINIKPNIPSKDEK